VTRSEVLIANERVKATANFLFNLSAALSAGTAARVWLVARFDVAALFWAVAALLLFALAYGVLYWLEPEA